MTCGLISAETKTDPVSSRGNLDVIFLRSTDRDTVGWLAGRTFRVGPQQQEQRKTTDRVSERSTHDQEEPAVAPARSVSRLVKDAKSQHELLLLSWSRTDGSALACARSRDPRKRAQGSGRTRFHGPQPEIILDTILLQIRLKLVALLMNCSALSVP